MRESTKPLVETELYNWYQEQLSLNERPAQSELLQKAKEINSQISSSEIDEDWNPTKGWLMRFKERFGIRPDTKPVEPKSSDWSALDAAEFLLEYVSDDRRDFLLKDVITLRMIRDKIKCEQDNLN